jgi:hypothetical protein
MNSEQVKQAIEHIKQHAVKHYDAGGWDVIVECKTDKELEEMIARCETPKQAFEYVAEIVSVWAERQADAINSAF